MARRVLPYFKGESFDVWEPFGDNSRYWIGPSDEPQRRRESIDDLESYVRNSWPGPISAAFGRLWSMLASVKKNVGRY